MSNFQPIGGEKIVIKTEPVDSFEWEPQQNASEMNHSYQQENDTKQYDQHIKQDLFSCNDKEIEEKLRNMKRNSSSFEEFETAKETKVNKRGDINKAKSQARSVKCKKKKIKDDDVFTHTTEEITRQVRKIKKNSSKKECLNDFPSEKGNTFKQFKRQNSEDTNAHFYNLQPKHSVLEEVQDSIDMKPTVEELEDYSRSVSKSNSVQSLSGDNSLGKTLATSLQLIATNTTSPIIPTNSNGTSYRMQVMSCTSSSHSSVAVTPVVVLSPVVPPRRYKTRSSSKTDKVKVKKERKSHAGNRADEGKTKFKDSEIIKPILNKDGSVTLYQCEECNKVFNKKQTLRQHFITHTNRFACPYCDARCKSKGDLRTHIQTHTKEKPYHCDVCNTDYTRESILRKHMKTQTHIRACYERDNLLRLQKQADKSSEKDVDQFIPAQTKVRLEGFSCSHCSKVMFSKIEYRRHVKSHDFKHVCNVCQKGCKTALLLKIHKRSHSKVGQLSCKVCARSFSNIYCLKEHIKYHKSSHFKKPTEEMLIKAAINKHNKDIVKLKSHTSSKTCLSSISKLIKLECEICQKTFSSEKRLENHARVHQSTYICGICKKAFGSVPKLKIHLRFHGRMFQCETCEKSFFDEKELQEHIQYQHILEKNYPCKICNDRFTTANELKQHVNHHAPTMLFSGASLEESTIPVVNRTYKKSSIGYHNSKYSETDSSDDEGSNAHKSSKPCDSDDDSILDSNVFFEIINNALDGSDDNLNDAELSDSDEELFSGIKAALESEVMSSGESDNGESKEPLLQKPILYNHNDIFKKNSVEFERYSLIDSEKSIFKCKLCDVSFDEQKYLKNHLKCHVCEYCNKFFTDKEKLAAHKSRHVKQLLREIKSEAGRLQIPRFRWKGFLMPLSDSDHDIDDQFLNELEDILEGEPPKVQRSVNFLHTLSHDEIVRANKQIFDHYSCLDLTNNIFACTICKRKYARPTTLTRHFKTHVCQFCNKFFEDKSDLLEHKYRHRKKAALMKAEITGEGSKMPPSPIVSKQNRDMFKRYSYVDSERNINRCTLCCKDFVRRTVLTRHMKTHICCHCDKFFEDKYDLAKHTTFHKVEKQYIDDDGPENDDFAEFEEDDKQYSTNSSIAGNLDNDDKNITLPPSYSSSIGHFNPPFHTQPTCSSRNDTITFIQIPSSESSSTANAQVYSAPGNGASSYQIISQPVEVYKENGQESFLVASSSCQGQESDKIITISQPQIVPTSSESRERLFECGECGKRFFKNGHLKSHMTIHTGDRPYVCRLCGKAFGRGTTLRKHEKTHMKRCKICDTSFTHKYELDLHMEIHRTYAFYK